MCRMKSESLQDHIGSLFDAVVFYQKVLGVFESMVCERLVKVVMCSE